MSGERDDFADYSVPPAYFRELVEMRIIPVPKRTPWLAYLPYAVIGLSVGYLGLHLLAAALRWMGV